MKKTAKFWLQDMGSYFTVFGWFNGVMRIYWNVDHPEFSMMVQTSSCDCEGLTISKYPQITYHQFILWRYFGEPIV